MNSERRRSDRGVWVHLHGHRSSAATLERQLGSHVPDGWRRTLPDAPVRADAGAFSWFGSGPNGPVPAELEHSLDVLDTLVGAAHTTGAWLAVGGFSQGASTALAWAMRSGSRRSGAGWPRIDALILQAPFLTEPDGYPIEGLRVQRVLVQHGRSDDVVPYFMGSDLAALLAGVAGVGHVDLLAYDGGHDPSAMAADAVEWLGASFGTPAEGPDRDRGSRGR
ncbi:MAG: hypothetical protein R2698_11310 [Microthrixaceae bacterium]